MIVVDIYKINHWMNARKVTLSSFKKTKRNLYNKLIKKKNFSINKKELVFLKKYLEVHSNDILLKEKITKLYIFF